MSKTNGPKLYQLEEEEALNRDAVDSPGKFCKMLQAGSKHKQSETVLKSLYIDCSFLNPMTIIIESLFSKCGCVITASHRDMMPCLFEAIVFLKENEDWWNIQLVQEMVAGLWKEKLSIYDYGNADDDYEGDW